MAMEAHMKRNMMEHKRRKGKGVGCNTKERSEEKTYPEAGGERWEFCLFVRGRRFEWSQVGLEDV